MATFVVMLFCLGCVARFVRWVQGDRQHRDGRGQLRPGVRLPAESVAVHGRQRELSADPDPILLLETEKQ